VFDNSDDLFVEARAIATRIGVSGAIFRLASQQPNGPASVFSNTTGFLDLTNQVYVGIFLFLLCAWVVHMSK